MGSDHYHPEFGWLAPTSRFRRELRVGFLSMLFGLSMGAIAVGALSVGGRDARTHSASPVGTRDVVAPSITTEAPPNGSSYNREPASINIDQTRTNNEVRTRDPIKPDTASTQPGNARRASGRGGVGSPAANDGPPIARVPLGRAESSIGTLQAGGRSSVAAQQSVGAERTTPPTLRQDLATMDRPNSNATSHNKRKTATSQPQRPEAAEDYRRIMADRTSDVDDSRTRVGRAPIPNSSSSPLGFWDWSR
jgi:hypothetical protein